VHRRNLAVVLALLALLIAGCGSNGNGGGNSSGGTGSSGGSSSNSRTAGNAGADYTEIIDVRTPAEYSASHVVGAVNIDVEDPGFAQQIAKVAKDGTYLVYCHSGNRAGTATTIMQNAGLTVTNGGGLADMRAAGYAFTT